MSSMPPPPPPPPTTPPPGWGSGPTPGYGSNRNYATFGMRLGASLLDGLLYGLLAAIGLVPGIVLTIAASSNSAVGLHTPASALGNSAMMAASSPSSGHAGGVLIGLVLILVGLLIGPFLQWRHLATTGQTWGRRIVGIKVVRADTGLPLGWGSTLGRALFKVTVSGWFFYIGFLWMLWDDNKQTWHDKVVNSIVVKA